MLGRPLSPAIFAPGFRARAATGLVVAVAVATLSFVSAGSAAVAEPPAPASAGPCTTRTYVVPQGVTRLSIRAVGAAGAQGRSSDLHGGGAGGLGAAVTNSPVEVTPGQTLYVGVATPSLAGGVGGSLYYSNGVFVSGARGGNGSLVTTAPPNPVDCSFDPTTMLIAAAGGGGGGNADLGGPGGTGGGAGAAGNPGGNNQDASGGGGSAGTETAPGAGGAAAFVYEAFFVCPTCKHRSTGVGGTGKKYGTGIGADRLGGIGGAGGSNDNVGAGYYGSAAGGGGGGVFGGGGGGGSGAGFNGQGTGAGGGGGGASYPASTAALTTEAPSVTFTPTYDTRTTLTSSVNPAQPGEAVTLRANVESINVDGTSGLTDGTVTFRDLGPTIESGESGVLLGAEAPFRNANGGVSSTLTVSNLAGGKHNITVRYSGTFPAAGASEPPLRASTSSLAQVVVNNQTVAFTSAPGARAAYGANYRPTVSSTSGLPVTISVEASAANVCFIDPATAPTVSFRAEGTCVLNADQAGSSDYLAAPRVKQSFPVAFGSAPQQQVITFTSTPPSELVAGTVYEVSAVGGGSGNPVTFRASSVFGSCFQAGPNKIRVDNGGSCTVIASQAGGPGFQGAEARQELFIPPFPQSIYFRTQPPATMAVGDVYALQASVSTRRLATFGTGAGSSACTVVRVPPTPVGNEISYATVTAIRTGPCVVTAQEITNDIYQTPSPLIQQTFLVGTAQTVEFDSTAPRDAVVGGTYTAVAGSATPNSGKAVTLTSATPSTCSLAGGVVSFVGAGACTLSADQDGTDVYAPAVRQSQTFTIAPAAQVVEFLSATPDPTVDDTYEPQVSGGVSSKPVVVTSGTPDTCEVSGGVVTFTGVGACALVAGQAADADYTAAISVVQRVTVRGLGQEIVLTSDAPTSVLVGDTYTPTASGGASGQPVRTGVSTPQVCSAAGGVVSFTGAGSCVVMLSQAGTSRYAAADEVTQTVEVGKAPQMVVFTSPVPLDAAVDGTYTPIVSGGDSRAPIVIDTGSPDTCVVADGIVTFTAVGDCTVTADQAGDADYTAAPKVDQTIVVRGLAQEIAVTSDVPSGAVVGDTYTPTATGGASGEPVRTGVRTPQVCSAAGGVVSFTGAGSCVVMLSQAGSSRYAAAADVTQTVEVGKAPQAAGTITDDDVAVVNPDPAVVPMDDPVDLVVEPLAACRIAAPVPAGYVEVKRASGSDRLLGSPKKEIFLGGAGDDRIYGGGGDDILCGRGGDDVLIGGSGNDEISGASGSDQVFGGFGDDRLLGASGDDRLVGGSGHDELSGRSGNDRLLGGRGDDRLAGGAGTDVLDGGQGTNVLDGGRD